MFLGCWIIIGFFKNWYFTQNTQYNVPLKCRLVEQRIKKRYAFSLKISIIQLELKLWPLIENKLIGFNLIKFNQWILVCQIILNFVKLKFILSYNWFYCLYPVAVWRWHNKVLLYIWKLDKWTIMKSELNSLKNRKLSLIKEKEQ